MPFEQSAFCTSATLLTDVIDLFEFSGSLLESAKQAIEMNSQTGAHNIEATGYKENEGWVLSLPITL